MSDTEVKVCSFYTISATREACSTCGIERSIYESTPCPIVKAEQTRPSLALVGGKTEKPAPPAPRHSTSASWLVQMQDGRVLRVDADTLDATNGILVFRAGIHNHAIAVFGYGDWKRVSIADRETGEGAGWVTIKERTTR